MGREFQKNYDVIVVGGGLAGVCAAISSARHGAKTAIIQNRPMFGGNASSEIRMHIVGAGCLMSKRYLNETGILMEILLENKWRNPYHSFSVWDSVIWEKVRFQENLESYLNTYMEEVSVSEKRINKIICQQLTTETTYVFSAPAFIDATGHGTLGRLAGAEYKVGSEGRDEFDEPNAPETKNNYAMGSSIMFQAVDRGEPVEYKKPFWAYSYSEEDLKYRRHDNGVVALGEGRAFTAFKEGEMKALPELSTTDAGYWWIELGGQEQDIIESGEMLRDELLKCVYGVWDHIKNGGNHGAENYELQWVGMVPGYRESRRLMGDYVLTENDIRSNRIFEDAVAYGGWPMDEHTPGGLLDLREYPSRIFNFDGTYTIPYRCYYSKNIENLMMAGRDISVSKMAYGSTRVMGTCAVGGQAVGTAAALAVRHRCLPREVTRHMDELQQTLLKDGCFLPGFKNTDPADHARNAVITVNSHTPGCGSENVINGIARSADGKNNYLEMDLSENKDASIRILLKEALPVKEFRIAFDPNLSCDMMPSILSPLVKRQRKGMPEELVSDYTVAGFYGGKEVYKQTISDNYQQLNVLKLPETMIVDALCVTVRKTHGSQMARIFEIRIY